MTLSDCKDKKILILGFGKEGKSTLAFLHRVFPHAHIGTLDKGDGPDYLALQKNYDVAIRTPGIPKNLVTIPSTTATNIFFECVRGITIGVTGTKGKSTTASLIHAMLNAGGVKSHLVGNIGNPMLSELLLSNERDDVFVVELSSYQLDDCAFSPHIAVFLNIFPDHMDYHGGMEEYMKAKENIARHCSHFDFFVYNQNYSALSEIAVQFPGKAIPFTPLENSSWRAAGSIHSMPAQDVMLRASSPGFINSGEFEEAPLLGAHNKENISAAATVANLMGISRAAQQAALSQFKPLPHRLEFVGKYKQILFYDDAISTTPESTIAAMKSISPVGTILLGGADRGYTFIALAHEIARRAIPNIVFFPDTGKKIKKEISAVAAVLPRMMETASMRDAVKFAYAVTLPDSLCMLSCASPSFSVWRDFEEKGNEFQKWVKELGKQ
ncbi:MAG: UDP-N-acetylmuramoyl-L-alanine--D-glutamate ligase [Candidatus Colwellbacteria bacterium]|nr:UDP-N-acetylmuramoyl-L-alanine--D-glutamate ligase [Candidatus Colwellbacteria bacterium]